MNTGGLLALVLPGWELRSPEAPAFPHDPRSRLPLRGGTAISTIWIFKTNYADPSYQVEFSPEPGRMPERFRFTDVHELRHFLDCHRLPGINSTEVLRRLAVSDHIELKTAA